jgi:aspartate carbamoyltransferase catalytic subunit
MMDHLPDIETLSTQDIQALIEDGLALKRGLASGHDYTNRLHNTLVLSLFFEASTRTRTSFEIAAKRLGADFITWDADTSSLSKGESFSDTIATLGAMGPDAVIVRHTDYNAPHTLIQQLKCPVINAGDSWRAHPTQALLDAMTIYEDKGRLEGLRIGICGDIAHSRVAASNIELLTKMGATIHIIGPEALLPTNLPYTDVHSFSDPENGLVDCDVVMPLRLQKERMQKGLIASEAEYHRAYGITYARLRPAREDVIVMHPGPMNRGIEIDHALADDPAYSRITQQVSNGVPMRMAIFDELLGQRGQ